MDGNRLGAGGAGDNDVPNVDGDSAGTKPTCVTAEEGIETTLDSSVQHDPQLETTPSSSVADAALRRESRIVIHEVGGREKGGSLISKEQREMLLILVEARLCDATNFQEDHCEMRGPNVG